MEKNLVLGSGISALAYLFYNHEALAIAGKGAGIGGLAAIQSKIGPHLLWVDSNTERLLKDLGLPTDQRTVRVGYLVGEHVVSGRHLTAGEFQSFRQLYSRKTRGVEAKASHMSGGAKEFRVFKIGMDDVAKKLLEAVQSRLIQGSVSEIDVYNRILLVEYKTTHAFETLISTIPAPVFTEVSDMAHLTGRLVAWDKVYRCTPYDLLPPWASEASGRYEYAYNADPRDTFHRIRFMPGYAVLEYSIPNLKDFVCNSACETITQPKGQIIAGAEIFESLPEYIRLLGRYAQWEHGVKFNQVLKRIHGN